MDLPAIQLLCLEQGDRPLDEHTRDFRQPPSPASSNCQFLSPASSGYALVRRHPACTFGSVWLRLPPSSAFVLSPTALPQSSGSRDSTSDAHHRGCTSVSSASSVVWALRHVSSTWVSISSGISIGYPQGGACYGWSLD
ncbi:hypothetical protein DPX16_17980 [Anabarilius grahami]|uniref:Uncharacterized protein n=1 Tax=Anabarilius grahami TaxID=495550 RepID=A0A3N0XTS8_ANAGA|nr:hypothetical protein DPX16_17980 [Anabarilius grahami]